MTSLDMIENESHERSHIGLPYNLQWVLIASEDTCLHGTAESRRKKQSQWLDMALLECLRRREYHIQISNLSR